MLLALGQDLLLKPILHPISLAKYVYTSYLVCYVLTYLTVTVFMISILLGYYAYIHRSSNCCQRVMM